MYAAEQYKDDLAWPAAAIYRGATGSDFVLVCEHASSFIPPELRDLGLAESARYSHVVWDIGADLLARRLAAQLKSPLVSGAISRLVYDCNRPPDAPDSIPRRSEIFDIPGNQALSRSEQNVRVERVHTPFHDTLAQVLDDTGPDALLVTIHSFTPVYKGQRRDVEIGFLHDQDTRVASALQAQDHRHWVTALNQPYSAIDGVTYTLRKHGVARGLHNVMIEVRNDLLETAENAQIMADHLAQALIRARGKVLE